MTDPLSSIQLGDEGYLINPEDWNREIASALAAREGIELTEAHWQVIEFMRAWYDEHGVAASPRDVGNFLRRRRLPRSEITRLFPYGYVQQACKIAGMKRPRSWSTG
ncbi:MAG: sulfite reductase subunit gamma [Hyphomicrobiales bacterium]|nr:MAG: sulfite reductase subunit gamma [Hyphomicrobiales bacterium]